MLKSFIILQNTFVTYFGLLIQTGGFKTLYNVLMSPKQEFLFSLDLKVTSRYVLMKCIRVNIITVPEVLDSKIGMYVMKLFCFVEAVGLPILTLQTKAVKIFLLADLQHRSGAHFTYRSYPYFCHPYQEIPAIEFDMKAFLNLFKDYCM
jgi:hypothetical protein